MTTVRDLETFHLTRNSYSNVVPIGRFPTEKLSNF